MLNLFEEAARVSYPGRGIVIGRSQDGKKAVAAYWTMGRSEQSEDWEMKGRGKYKLNREYENIVPFLPTGSKMTIYTM